MKKAVILLVAAIILLAAAAFLHLHRPSPQGCFETKCVSLEVADTPNLRRTGYMNRSEISFDEGMLFVYDGVDFRGFWMKDVSFGLDIIWLDSDRRVVGVTYASPCVGPVCRIYYSPEPVQYVLEVGEGFSERYGVSEGDLFSF